MNRLAGGAVPGQGSITTFEQIDGLAVGDGTTRQTADGAIPITGAAVNGIQAVLLTHREALLRFLRARGAAEEAEDLLQELWLKTQDTGPISQPLPYLYRMANNLMLDQRRSHLRRRRREGEWSDAVAPPDLVASDIESGDRLLMARDRIRKVDALLAALGGRTEQIFRRFRIEGATQHEIAGEFGISLSAVEKHLQKAYRALLHLRSDLDVE